MLGDQKTLAVLGYREAVRIVNGIGNLGDMTAGDR